MTDEPKPATIAGAASSVAGKLVESFGGAPALLSVVLLNIAMLGGAIWVMDSREALRAENLSKVLALLEKCLK